MWLFLLTFCVTAVASAFLGAGLIGQPLGGTGGCYVVRRRDRLHGWRRSFYRSRPHSSAREDAGAAIGAVIGFSTIGDPMIGPRPPGPACAVRLSWETTDYTRYRQYAANAMLTMLPPRTCRMAGTTALQQFQMPLTFTAIAASQSASLIVSKRPPLRPP